MKSRIIISTVLVLLISFGTTSVAPAHPRGGGTSDYVRGYYNRPFRGWYGFSSAHYWRRGPGDHGMPPRMTRAWYPRRRTYYHCSKEFFHHGIR